VSNAVTIVLQVWMVAVPDVLGVHWYTDSGDVDVDAHVPACWLVPEVEPTNVPPPAGIIAGSAHVVGASVVVVSEVVVVTVVVVTVVGVGGGVMVRLKLPLWPEYPSTTM